MLGRQKQEPEPIVKKYQVGTYKIYQFNNNKYVIATSLEEAILVFKDYQEKDDDPWRGSTIKTIELITDNALSKSDGTNIVEL